jgi:cell division protein FtsB
MVGRAGGVSRSGSGSPQRPRSTTGRGVGRTDGRANQAERWRELGPIVAVVILAFAVLAGLAVLPARTWWTQRQNMNEARAELEQMEAEVTGLQAQQDLLQTDAEIERLARENFDLVRPGEESYRLVPPGEEPAGQLSQQSGQPANQ